MYVSICVCTYWPLSLVPESSSSVPLLSSTVLGYQRASTMFWPTVQVDVLGLNNKVLTVPHPLASWEHFTPSMFPPVAITVPFCKIVMPEQEMSSATGNATLVSAPVIGLSTIACEL